MDKRTQKRTIDDKQGFTLIETLVGISILIVAVVVPMVFLSRDISAAFSVKDKITALYLAEDAMDFIKYKIDTSANSGAADWLQDFTYVCGFSPAKCQIDSFNNQVIGCGGATCPPMKIDPVSGVYGYSPGWTDSKFTRTIIISPESGIVPSSPGPDTGSNAEGVSVDVIISWTDKGATQQFTLKGYAYNWLGVLPYPIAP